MAVQSVVQFFVFLFISSKQNFWVRRQIGHVYIWVFPSGTRKEPPCLYVFGIRRGRIKLGWKSQQDRYICHVNAIVLLSIEIYNFLSNLQDGLHIQLLDWNVIQQNGIL
jgi:hypothetical protein